MNGDPFGIVGSVLDGKFRVDALVGEGELSIVYKGHDLGTRAPVAIKLLHLPDTLDEALTRPVVQAFEEAARAQERVGRESRHVARCIATGRTVAPLTGATVPYRVREWFEGESLASDLARRRRQGEKARTVREAVALLAPAVEGIAHAHEQGIAHLSLSPGNLFLARLEGALVLKVLDLGSARASSRDDGRPTLDSEVTRGLHLLHPAYAAPEQLDMEVGEPGAWTDVYALALILMEILAERSSIQGLDTPALVERALDERKRPTPQEHGLNLPRGLDLVLTRAVARRPADRPRNARVFLIELNAAVGQRAPAKPQALVKAPGSERPAPPPLVLPPPSVPQPGARPVPPAAAASGPLATAPESGSARVPALPSPPAFVGHAGPDPALDALEDKLAGRHRSPSRARWVGTGAAALAAAGMAGVLLVFARAHHRSEPATGASMIAAVATGAPLAAPPAKAAPPAAAPIPSPVAPPVPPKVAKIRAIPERTAAPHAPAEPPTVRFSQAAAQRAINGVKRGVARCRHGRFWGRGYATVAFANDGTVQEVLVDPPFSMTVTGKCVADALGSAHMRSFGGHIGYYRFPFYIAAR